MEMNQLIDEAGGPRGFCECLKEFGIELPLRTAQSWACNKPGAVTMRKPSKWITQALGVLMEQSNEAHTVSS